MFTPILTTLNHFHSYTCRILKKEVGGGGGGGGRWEGGLALHFHCELSAVVLVFKCI